MECMRPAARAARLTSRVEAGGAMRCRGAALAAAVAAGGPRVAMGAMVASMAAVAVAAARRRAGRRAREAMARAGG